MMMMMILNLMMIVQVVVMMHESLAKFPFPALTGTQFLNFHN